jgi:hypothetical protein
MNKRCIVNVATGEFYCKMQERLIESLYICIDGIKTYYADGKVSSSARVTNEKGIDLITWNDCLPHASRPHSESPYGFKVHAIKKAYEMGYTSILWIDSPAYAVKEDISPIFDKIEKEGYYAMSHIDPLENWVSESYLKAFGINRDSLIGFNLPSGSCYGFDLNNDNIWRLFCVIQSREKSGFFMSEQISEGKWHRHDEAVLAMALKDYEFPVFTFDPLFQSDSPECVIKSGWE